MVALGYLNMDGTDGTKLDWTEAVKWYKRAAELGRGDAANFLGFIYENGGVGVDQDITNAVNYYRQAAEDGDAKGQMNLGRMYNDGKGVEQNPLKPINGFSFRRKTAITLPAAIWPHWMAPIRCWGKCRLRHFQQRN